MYNPSIIIASAFGIIVAMIIFIAIHDRNSVNSEICSQFNMVHASGYCVPAQGTVANFKDILDAR